MRFSFRGVLTAVIALSIVVLAACGHSGNAIVSPAQLTFSATGSNTGPITSATYTVKVGGTPYLVIVNATKGDGTPDTFTATSSNPAVATVIVSGSEVTITPVAVGTANVVLTSGSDPTIARMISVTVTGPAKLTLAPTSTTYAAKVGDAAYQVTVTATKGDGSADTFTVASSNQNVVTATATGNVVTITPVATGTASILFTSGSDSTVTKTIAATISPAPPATLTLAPASLTYAAKVGDAAYTVTVTATKSNGTADAFTVLSNNTAVVTATAVGNLVTITPVGVGTANIVFTSGSDNTVTKTIAATISPAPPATLTLNPAITTYTAKVGDAASTVTVTATKSNGTADTFTVSSNNTAVVTATAVGNVVTITPVGVGTTNIVFTSGSDNTVTKTVTATITVPVQLTLSPSSLTYTAMVGDAATTVTVTATKNDGTPDTFTVLSNNTAVVTATAVGNTVTITPVSAGATTIVFTSASDNTVTKTIAATITAPAVSGCDGTEYFCDDFQSENSNNWTLTAGTGGAFAVVPEPGNTSNYVLQYTAGSAGGVIALLNDSVWDAAVTNNANVTNKGDYYVEARIMPQVNGTTGNKQLYMIGRYQDAANWYLGGLNMQTSTPTKVDAGWDLAGGITRKVQAQAQVSPPNLVMGTQGATNGQWYTVRFEMIGGTLTVYLNGAKMGSYTISGTDPSFTSGKIGLWTANKSFLIDDIRVGDPTIKPVQLTLSSGLTYAAEQGDAPLNVNVTATKSDGVTPDTFSVTTSDSTVVSIVVNGNTVTLNPIGVGTANIVFTSGSNPKVTRTIAATITNSFVMPTTSYGNLTGKILPAAGEPAAYLDDKLVLTFDAPPTLGTSGSIRVFKTSDNSLVDVIKMAGDVDSIGAGYSTNARGVADTPVWVSGNNLVIAPHQSKLAYSTGYYIAIANGAVTGTLAGQNFVGIGTASGLPLWSFTTKAAPATGLTTLTVAATGASDFHSVQGALNYVMANVPTTTPATINVMDGTYQELLFLRGNSNVTIKGQSRTGTVIQYNNYDGLNTGSGASNAGTPTSGGGRSLFLVESSDYLTLDTLTLKNTHLRSSPGAAQAETIYYNNDTGHLIAKNAEFYSEQDTLQLKGYNWFYNTLISGNVDFIWGNNRTSLFENSEIRMIGDSSTTTPTALFYLQARTVTGERGFFFLNDTLTTGPGPNGNTLPTGANAVGYLARAASGAWVDNVLYINCKMDTHINTLGWAANVAGNPVPNPAVADLADGWREFGSMDLSGNPLDLSGRSTNSYHGMVQSDIDANYATRALIFSNIGWNPQP
jgi:pectate lyase